MTDGLVFTTETLPSPTREVDVVLSIVNFSVFLSSRTAPTSFPTSIRAKLRARRGTVSIYNVCEGCWE